MDKLMREDQRPEAGGQMIRLKRGQEKPDTFRLMSDGEVIQRQMKIISTWKPRSEMWPFSWGTGLLGGVAGLTGIVINNFWRRKLQLQNFARVGTYAPTAVLPVLCCAAAHNLLITNEILVGNFPCTVCAATRSGALQAGFGAIYPMFIGPVTCIIAARRYHTYFVPRITNFAEVSSFLKKITPITGTMLALVLVNFGLGMLISERETLLFEKFLSPSWSPSTEYDDEGFK